MGDSHRVNVATWRQQEALYLVGKHQYWSEVHIVADMARTQGPIFVVGQPTFGA